MTRPLTTPSSTSPSRFDPSSAQAWALLDDAYGAAHDVFPLLQRLLAWSHAPAGEGQPFPEDLNQALWSRLCHQDTVYTASYAAFPMLVDAIQRCGTNVPVDLLTLVVCIDRSRRDGVNGPKVPQALGPSYVKALLRLPALMVPVLLHAPDEALVRTALAASASAAGCSDVAMALLDLDVEA